MTDRNNIIRIEKNPDNPFVMMDKRPLNNKGLSWKAKGLLAYLLSKPDDWEIIKAHLVNEATDGETSLDTAIKELKDAGHMRWFQGQNGETGLFEPGHWKVYEKPVTATPKIRSADNPVSGKSGTTNTDTTKKDGTDISTPDGEKEVPLGIANKIFAGQEVTEDDLGVGKNSDTLDEREIQDAAYLIAQGANADLKDLAVAFMTARQILPGLEKSTLAYWRKYLRQMRSARPKPVKAEHVTKAVKELLKDKMTVSSPRSVLQKAIDIANPAPGQSDGEQTRKQVVWT